MRSTPSIQDLRQVIHVLFRSNQTAATMLAYLLDDENRVVEKKV